MLNAASLSIETLAGALEQSVDCVKLVDVDGVVRWMNANGQCAMEVDDFAAIRGKPWAELWPTDARHLITGAMRKAASGATVRFDAYCPTARGAPRWWNVCVSAVHASDGSPSGFLAVSRDITEAEAKRQAHDIAAAELRHRLRNTYTMVGSLLAGFARGVPDREAFAQEMIGRLAALSSAQSLFATHDAPCDIDVLIPALVVPFDSPNCPIQVDPLPPVQVDQGQADAIALALGELAVNSAKHGALAFGGTIRLHTLDDYDRLDIKWVETSATPVAAQARDGGQGLTLIERIVRARGGDLSVAWQPRGLTVTLSFKVKTALA
jgi:PAS domain S-box-containing protein